MINLNLMLKRWENVIEPPKEIDTWDDIWINTVYWTEKDPFYAGNTLLAYMSAQEDSCPSEYIDAAILWFLNKDSKPQITADSVFPDWCLQAVHYLEHTPLTKIIQNS